jgi:hypothetical protein
MKTSHLSVRLIGYLVKKNIGLIQIYGLSSLNDNKHLSIPGAFYINESGATQNKKPTTRLTSRWVVWLTAYPKGSGI